MNGYRDAIEAVVALFDVQREALSGHGSDVLEEFQRIDDRGGRAAAVDHCPKLDREPNLEAPLKLAEFAGLVARLKHE